MVARDGREFEWLGFLFLAFGEAVDFLECGASLVDAEEEAGADFFAAVFDGVETFDAVEVGAVFGGAEEDGDGFLAVGKEPAGATPGLVEFVFAVVPGGYVVVGCAAGGVDEVDVGEFDAAAVGGGDADEEEDVGDVFAGDGALKGDGVVGGDVGVGELEVVDLGCADFGGSCAMKCGEECAPRGCLWEGGGVVVEVWVEFGGLGEEDGEAGGAFVEVGVPFSDACLFDGGAKFFGGCDDWV